MWQKIKNIYHLGVAILANVFYGFPSKKIRVIGVTGTDGKTTTVSLIYHILNNAGLNASMVTSIGAVIGGKSYDVGFHVTTPSPWDLQRFIKKISNIKYQISNIKKKDPRIFNYLVLEVTSHAIDQNRIWGIPFDIGVLTNVTHEHLDYHKTYENYVKAKAKLLKMARVAVINKDDESYELILNIKNKISKIHSKNKKWVTYGIKSNADINPQAFPFKTELIGEFNKYNVLAAVAVCRELEISDQVIREAILTFKMPIGREDIVYKKDFTVMIDFAHTPNAFEQILSSIKPSIKGKLIHVFGSAGQRDAPKRPLMGKTSAEYSDVIIITAEDPRSEPVEKIIREVESGIMNHELRIREKTLLTIPDRQEAINTAIKMVKKGDFVLITGKSHEKSMNYGQGEVAWDEYGVVAEAIKKRK